MLHLLFIKILLLATQQSNRKTGGVLLALIEGVGILFTRYSAEQFKPVNPQMEDPSQLNTGGIFGSAAPQ
ncbi:mitochondrial import inner membrane translocase subunit TIM17 [Trichonephila clavipes]|nr:mitochondrial import inner membrane translocase subunit TIM17 [Trichonephila clavipes]